LFYEREALNKPGKYDARGVSSGKEDVHAAISDLDRGLFPNAFCKITEDIAGGDAAMCNVMHADGAGTKSSLAYMYWRETGDLSVWRGIARDAIVMNTDDLMCIGAIDNILVSGTIGRNKFRIPGEVIREIITGTEEFLEMLRGFGISIRSTGGETADVNDLVRTIIVDTTVFCRMPRAKVIDIRPHPGDAIVGFASFGKAVYEDSYNGGMGSNGLSSARHDVFSREYATRYPESFDSDIPPELVFSGSRKLTDPVEGTGLDCGKLMLASTRTYLPVVRKQIAELGDSIHGMIHCTGGGQTKVMNFMKGMHVIKDNLFPVPPLFQMIRDESKTDWKEMYRVFNMGHLLEIFLPPEDAETAIAIAGEFGIEARVIGRCESAKETRLSLLTPTGMVESY